MLKRIICCLIAILSCIGTSYAYKDWNELKKEFKSGGSVLTLKLLMYGQSDNGTLKNSQTPSKDKGNENEFLMFISTPTTGILTLSHTCDGEQIHKCKINGSKIYDDKGWWMVLRSYEIFPEKGTAMVITEDCYKTLRIYYSLSDLK